MKKVSFLMPTNKPFAYFGQNIINAIYQADKCGFNYEILIFSSEKVDLPNVRWFDDREHNNSNAKTGAVYGYNFLLNQCDGDYITIGVDDQLFSGPFFNIFTQLDDPIRWTNKRFTLLSMPCRDKCHLNDDPNIGYLPRYVMPRYPALSRDTINKELNGVLFHPAFHHHYADSWLGYYLGEAGEMAIEADGCGSLQPYGGNGHFPYDNEDKATFLQLIENYKNGNYLYYEPH